MQYSIKEIGAHRGAPRLYFQGGKIPFAGFTPGTRYKIELDPSRKIITLSLSGEGDRIVSKKDKGGTEIPVIDINSAKMLEMFAGMEKVRVVIRTGSIQILPLASHNRRIERLDRLKAKLDAGQPISIGSLSHGGGILSHAIHKAMVESGMPCHLAWANDIREELLEHASVANEAWDANTQQLAAPMQELAFDEWFLGKLPKVDLLEAGIPCSGASLSGRSKLGTSMAEEHPEVGHLVVAFLAIIAKVNPAVILLENVPQYQGTASMHCIRYQLRDMGYDIHETLLDGAEWGVHEHRKRMCMVAVTQGMSFDFAELLSPKTDAGNLASILEDIPADHPSWSEMTGLKAKQERDKEAGKGFMMQVFTPADTRIATITKGYAKIRSTDPKIAHPSNPDLLRQLTPAEHARCKGIPEQLIAGISNTLAHEILGQSIVYPPFVAIGKMIAETLKKGFQLIQSTELSPTAAQFDLLAA